MANGQTIKSKIHVDYEYYAYVDPILKRDATPNYIKENEKNNFSQEYTDGWGNLNLVYTNSGNVPCTYLYTFKNVSGLQVVSSISVSFSNGFPASLLSMFEERYGNNYTSQGDSFYFNSNDYRLRWKVSSINGYLLYFFR